MTGRKEGLLLPPIDNPPKPGTPEAEAPEVSTPASATPALAAPEIAVPKAAVQPATPPAPDALRHHWVVRVTHWANALLLVGMIGSGLQIYGAYPRFGPRDAGYDVPNPLVGHPLPSWFRLGGWLAGGLQWHFALAWPFVLSGVLYLGWLAFSGEWRTLAVRPRDLPRALQMQLYYLRLRREHPPQGKHNALQKGAYSFILLLGAIAVLSGFALYKPVQLAWLTRAFGGYELTRYWHFVAVWLFVGFIVVHVVMVFAVDPPSLRAMITGRYRGRFPNHD